MARKPVYGKILASRNFGTREMAEGFAKDMKKEYKDADMSLRYDIERTQEGQWRSTIYVKVD